MPTIFRRPAAPRRRRVVVLPVSVVSPALIPPLQICDVNFRYTQPAATDLHYTQPAATDLHYTQYGATDY